MQRFFKATTTNRLIRFRKKPREDKKKKNKNETPDDTHNQQLPPTQSNQAAKHIVAAENPAAWLTDLDGSSTLLQADPKADGTSSTADATTVTEDPTSLLPTLPQLQILDDLLVQAKHYNDTVVVPQSRRLSSSSSRFPSSVGRRYQRRKSLESSSYYNHATARTTRATTTTNTSTTKTTSRLSSSQTTNEAFLSRRQTAFSSLSSPPSSLLPLEAETSGSSHRTGATTAAVAATTIIRSPTTAVATTAGTGTSSSAPISSYYLPKEESKRKSFLSRRQALWSSLTGSSHKKKAESSDVAAADTADLDQAYSNLYQGRQGLHETPQGTTGISTDTTNKPNANSVGGADKNKSKDEPLIQLHYCYDKAAPLNDTNFFHNVWNDLDSSATAFTEPAKRMPRRGSTGSLSLFHRKMGRNSQNKPLPLEEQLQDKKNEEQLHPLRAFDRYLQHEPASPIKMQEEPPSKNEHKNHKKKNNNKTKVSSTNAIKKDNMVVVVNGEENEADDVLATPTSTRRPRGRRRSSVGGSSSSSISSTSGTRRSSSSRRRTMSRRRSTSGLPDRSGKMSQATSTTTTLVTMKYLETCMQENGDGILVLDKTQFSPPPILGRLTTTENDSTTDTSNYNMEHEEEGEGRVRRLILPRRSSTGSVSSSILSDQYLEYVTAQHETTKAHRRRRPQLGRRALSTSMVLSSSSASYHDAPSTYLLDDQRVPLPEPFTSASAGADENDKSKGQSDPTKSMNTTRINADQTDDSSSSNPTKVDARVGSKENTTGKSDDGTAGSHEHIVGEKSKNESANHLHSGPTTVTTLADNNWLSQYSDHDPTESGNYYSQHEEDAETPSRRQQQQQKQRRHLRVFPRRYSTGSTMVYDSNTAVDPLVAATTTLEMENHSPRSSTGRKQGGSSKRRERMAAAAAAAESEDLVEIEGNGRSANGGIMLPVLNRECRQQEKQEHQHDDNQHAAPSDPPCHSWASTMPNSRVNYSVEYDTGRFKEEKQERKETPARR
ncbi:hypothetical protein ACA910_008698 [Epithemia clementina (nom. ined.)]